MIAALSLMFPLSVAGAVSPMMLTEQIVVLGSRGPRAAWRYALGATLTLLVLVLLLVFLGGVVELPAKPKLSASLDIVLGACLIVAGLAMAYVGRHPLRRSRPHDSEKDAEGAVGRHGAAFPFGVFSMLTNFTTIAIVTIASKQIAGAKTDTAGRIFLVAFLVVVCAFPAWGPPALTKLAPASGQRLLEALRGLIERRGRQAVIVLLIVAGAWMLARGIFDVKIHLPL